MSDAASRPPADLAPVDLAGVRRFAARLPQGAWFAACGEALTPVEREDARAWLGGLGLAVAAIEGVATWDEASAVARGPDWSRAWWEAESRERRRLHAASAAVFGEAALLAALSEVAEAALAVLHGAAAIAATRQGVADSTLTHVAAGAAAQACDQAALALAAGAGESHPFAAKHRLFAAGRWPLGVVGDRGFVF